MGWGYKQYLLPGDCKSGVSLFISFLNLPPGNCLPECSLFIRFLNLSPGDCGKGVQPVLLVLNIFKRTVRWGASCFFGF